MSVSSTTNRAAFAGNGVTTAFAFPYYFFAQSDLVVTLTDNVSGAVTAQTLNADYTVSGTPDANGLYSAGGTVTFSVAPPTGKTAQIVRVLPDTQSATWSDTDFAKAVGFDKLTLITQRLFDLFSRVPLLPDGVTSTFNSALPTVMTPNAFLAVNGAGNGWTLVGSGTAQGTVTSVGLSVPAEFTAGASVTTAGSLSFTKNNQSANLVYAGPNSGGAAAPTFRALVSADIPQLALTSLSSGAATINQVPIANGSGGITWSTIVGTGTVTSIGVIVPAEFSASAAVTTSGNVTLTKAAQAKNTLWAGPTSGANAAPAFRNLVAADLPVMTAASAGAGGAAGAVPSSSAGDQVHFLRGDATWVAVPQGTVTSIDLVMPSEFSVSGDPVTSSGTLTVAKTVQAPNKFWAGPSAAGPSAAPTFRAIVGVDLPVMVGCTSIASGVAGAVPSPSAGQQSLFLRGDATWSLPVVASLTGPFATPAISANTTLASLQQFAVVAGNTGPIDVTMPTCASMIQTIAGSNYASPVVIVNNSAFAVTLLPQGGDQIQNGASAKLTLQGDSYTLFPTPTGWLIT